MKQLSSVVKMMMLTKQRPAPGTDIDDKQSLIEEMETGKNDKKDNIRFSHMMRFLTFELRHVISNNVVF